MGRYWAPEEDAELRDGRSHKKLAIALGRSVKSVEYRMHYLGLTTATVKFTWTGDENRILRQAVKDGKTLAEICVLFPNRTQRAVANKCRASGQYAKRDENRPWTAADDALLQPNIEIPDIPGRTRSAIVNRYRRLKIPFIRKRAQCKHTPELIERVRALVEQGLYATRIGLEVGLSKNAVIGLCSRQGIKFKPRVAKPRIRRPRMLRKPTERKPSIRLIKSALVPVVEAPPPGALPLWELQKHDCRWPYGDGPFLFCGAESHPGSSYCPYHTRRAWLSLTDERAPFQQSSLAG